MPDKPVKKKYSRAPVFQKILDAGRAIDRNQRTFGGQDLPLQTTEISAAKMSGELLEKYEHQMGLQKTFSTEFTWTLNNWSLLYDSTYKKGVRSPFFYLNGTNGYTCDISLSPTNLDRAMTIQFSDTQEIEAMKVVCRIGNNLCQTNYYSRPVLKSYTYPMNHVTSGDGSYQTAASYSSSNSAGDRINSRSVFGQTPVRNSSSSSQSLLNHDVFGLTWKSITNEAVVIVLKITIMTASDSISPADATTPPSVTLSKCDYPPRNVLANFKCTFDRKAFCDVSLVLGDKKFYAHKAVLGAQSTVFEAMFLNEMKEQKESTVEILDRDEKVFEQFLNYLYGGEVTELKDTFETMIAIADFYDVPNLKNKCESVMVESLSKNNVVGYVILADKLNCEKLKKEALRLIRNSAPIMEEALVENDAATIMCLKEILSKNRAPAKTEPREDNSA